MTLDNQARRIQELIDLTHTYGRGDIIKIIQQKIHPHPATYIGPGKADEIARQVIPEFEISTVITNAILKPKQLFNLTQKFWEKHPSIEVWDRVDLILHIFKNHAVSSESKLQIEIAAMRHMGPRVYNLSSMLGRQRGGRGSVGGAGETNTGEMQSHWKRVISAASIKLEHLEEHRMRHLDRRKELGLKTVSIVGYTNAGKSTLFNALTRKHKLVKDALFATLDSASGKLYFPELKDFVLISDTIGFIRNLPPELIDAFKSTLLETIHADLLVHVVDASDLEMSSKMETVRRTLDELGVAKTPIITVFNKIDMPTSLNVHSLKRLKDEYGGLFISAKSGEGLEAVKDAIQKTLIHTYYAPPIET